ncbi:MAG TPA: HAMP domain-containing sensor histidine kinase [Gemmatimonadales bacterium]|nr:HAMP domain-containing sensor histidine kinase [Gemmatimonadales bacterium]
MPKDFLRQRGPAVLGALALLLGALSVGYAWVVARHLRTDARETSRLLARVFAGLSDPGPDAATEALLDLAERIRTLGVPVVVTDAQGRVTAVANSPLPPDADSTAVRAWIGALDTLNEPVRQSGVGTVHFGALPIERPFQALAVLQLAVLLSLAGFTWWAYRSRLAAARDRLWVAMARESAHQLGTPLMSLTGWIAYLRENTGTTAAELADHLQTDVDRLERVARRFERIGRPARREPVGLGSIAERVVQYFRPRLPTLSAPIVLELTAAGPGPTALGDPVLVEWAIEAVVRNALDAVSGRGGRIEVFVDVADRLGRIRVVDDGPGVPPEVRSQLFEPGVSTKAGGWGIGLALARRVVEQQHGGRILYQPRPSGAEFVLEFPLVAPVE